MSTPVGRGSLVLAILAVSWAAPLRRIAPEAPSIQLAFWRLLIAGLILLIIARPRGLLRWRAWIPGSIAGALLALHFGAWFRSLELTSVASSVSRAKS